MRKVIPMNNDLQLKVLPRLRTAFYGQNASAAEYRDSFVVCETIARYEEDAALLMNDRITESERTEKNITKTLNFRADCYLKLTSLADQLAISPAEACRRILYYTAEYAPKTSSKEFTPHELSQLKAKILMLEESVKALGKALLLTQNALSETKTEITRLEGDVSYDI